MDDSDDEDDDDESNKMNVENDEEKKGSDSLMVNEVGTTNGMHFVEQLQWKRSVDISTKRSVEMPCPRCWETLSGHLN